MRLYGHSQGPIQRVDGTVPLCGRDHPLPLDEELYSSLDRRLAAGPLLGDDAEALQLEERLRLACGPTDQERERSVRRLVVVALVLPLLYRGEHRSHVPRFQIQLHGLGPNRVLPRELPDRRAPEVAYPLGRDVLVGSSVFGYAVNVQPALVGECAPAYVGRSEERRVGKEGRSRWS